MFIQNRSSGAYSEVNIVQQTIEKANNIDLLEILNNYNISIDLYNKKTCCPFPFHKDKTPSFYYYPDNNNFYCFGCKSGGKSVDFVSVYENITKYKAALIILDNFSTINIVNNSNNLDYKFYLEFSHLIRNFILKNNDKYGIQYAENIASAFDEIRFKYSLDPDGLKVIFNKLKNKLENYSKCRHY